MSSDTGQNVPADAAGPAVVAAVTRFLASHGKGLPSHDDCLHHVRASALGAGLEEQRLAVLVRAALLNTVACEDEANAPVVDECIRRIREAGDGGDSRELPRKSASSVHQGQVVSGTAIALWSLTFARCAAA